MVVLENHSEKSKEESEAGAWSGEIREEVTAEIQMSDREQGCRGLPLG